MSAVKASQSNVVWPVGQLTTGMLLVTPTALVILLEKQRAPQGDTIRHTKKSRGLQMEASPLSPAEQCRRTDAAFMLLHERRHYSLSSQKRQPNSPELRA
jgi:hypothetical protein